MSAIALVHFKHTFTVTRVSINLVNCTNPFSNEALITQPYSVVLSSPLASESSFHRPWPVICLTIGLGELSGQWCVW